MQSQELKRTVIRDIIGYSEGALGDLLDNTKDLWDKTKGYFSSPAAPYGSISNRAAQYVLVFPVIVSSTIDVATSIMISKAIERKCCSLLQILFSAINLTDYNNSADLAGYLSKFHTNLDPGIGADKLSLDDFITMMKTVKQESFVEDKDIFNHILEELKYINDVAKDFINETSINDYSIKKLPYGEISIDKISNRVKPISELNIFGRRLPDPTINPADSAAYPPKDLAEEEPKKEKSPSFKLPSDDAKYFTNQILKSDFSKANELMPTNMVVTFTTLVPNAKSGDTTVQRSAVVGVKAKMYPVESSEIIAKITSKYTNSTLMDLVQVSTGEKSFLKDFVFGVDKLKSDAIRLAKGSINSKIFNLLERRANRNNSLLMKHGDASPITTLVISQEEVEYLKKYNKINLESSDVVRILFNGYNLMGLVITDDATETAKFLYDDGDRMFSTLSYKALEKEAGDTSAKQIVNLMSKVAR